MKSELKKYIRDKGFLSDRSCLCSRFKFTEESHSYLMTVTSFYNGNMTDPCKE